MSSRTARGNDAHGSATDGGPPVRVVAATLYRSLFVWLPAGLMLVMTAVIVADVVGRYVLNAPIVWASEVALVMFIWLVYLAAVDVAGRGGHIAVDVVTERLPIRAQAAVATLTHLLTLSVLTYLSYFGVVYFFEGRFTSLPSLDLSKRFVELAIPVSAIGIGAHTLMELWAALRGVATGAYQPKTTEADTGWDSFEDTTLEVRR